MNEWLGLAAVLSGYLLSRLGEWKLSERHRRYFEVFGVEELIPSTMRWYYATTLVMVPVAIAWRFYQNRSVALEQTAIGLTLLLIALGLRAWAVQTLGSYWTMGCFCIPKENRVNGGPYRFVEHPEYLSRLLDTIAIALVTGAEKLLPLILLVQIIFAMRIQRAEAKAWVGELTAATTPAN